MPELFYLLPETIERRRDLRPGAKIAVAVLRFHGRKSDDIYPSVPTVGREMGVGTAQARKYLHELAKKRVIAVDESPGVGFSNRYHFLDARGNRISGKTASRGNREHCSVIPAAVMAMKSKVLSQGAKVLYGRLARYQYLTEMCTKPEIRLKYPDHPICPSYPEMAAAIGVSAWRAEQSVKELEANGLLEVDRVNLRYDTEGRGGTPGYRVLSADWRAAERVKLRRREERRKRERARAALQGIGGDPRRVMEPKRG